MAAVSSRLVSTPEKVTIATALAQVSASIYQSLTLLPLWL